MKQRWRRPVSLALAWVLALSLSTGAWAAVSDERLADTVTDTAAYMYRTVKDPQVGSIGGEWAVLGLARSGYEVPEEYYQKYYATVESYVKACDGVLHDKKYTEYSRLIVALSSIGKDARDVAGYDLTKPLGDYGKTIWQGLNGPIWALIALDSKDYPMPENPEAATQATRQMYVDELLARELPDGGWTLTGGEPDVDITAMTLQALAKYREQPDAAAAVERGLAVLSSLQEPDGGYVSWGSSNSESVAQVIVALTELGVPLDDERFTKNGITVEDALLPSAQENGAFVHVRDGSGGDDGMATEQAFYALAAIHRAETGETTLYDMTDVMQ